MFQLFRKYFSLALECVVVIGAALFIYYSQSLQEKISPKKYWNQEIQKMETETQLEKWHITSLEVELEKLLLEKKAYLERYDLLPFPNISLNQLKEKYEKEITKTEKHLQQSKAQLQASLKKLRAAKEQLAKLNKESNKRALVEKENPNHKALN